MAEDFGTALSRSVFRLEPIFFFLEKNEKPAVTKNRKRQNHFFVSWPTHFRESTGFVEFEKRNVFT